MFGKTWLGFLSIMVSMVLWVNFGKNEPVNQRQMDVPIVLLNQPRQLLAVGLAPKLKVVASGTSRQLDALNPDAMQVQVDLTRAEPGTKVYELKLLDADKLPATVNLTRNVLRVTLERRATITRSVEVETVGKRPEQFKYAGATVQPEIVTLSGPESDIKRVAKVRALLDLAGVKPGISKDVEVEILTDNYRRIPNVVAEPTSVTVLPGVVAAPSSISLLVTPRWRGQPAFGFQVDGYSIVPNQVQLTGKNDTLAGITMVDTEPIDLSGVKSTLAKSVRLKVPDGARLIGGDEVTVTIRIVPVPATEPEP